MVIIRESCKRIKRMRSVRKKEEEYEKILNDLVNNQTYKESPFERIFEKINPEH